MRSGYIPYLNLNDYLLQIRSGQLNQQLLDPIEEGGDFERQEAESFALDEVRSLLGSYFYLDFEFRDLLPYDPNVKYFAGDRCILDFPSWNASGEVILGVIDEDSTQSGYKENDLVVWNGTGIIGDGNQWYAYSCTVPNNDAGFDPNKWLLLGKQYDIFFVNFPYPIFQLVPTEQNGIEIKGNYKVGDSICWVNKLFTCRSSSLYPSHQLTEQFYQMSEIPKPNIFPNLPDAQYSDGNFQWKDNGEFSFVGITPFSSVSRSVVGLNDGVDAWTDQYRKQWTVGDNRSSTMKQIIVALSIYSLLGRNSFMLKERAIRRDWAYRKMELIRKGEDTTLIPIIQPEQVGNISFGGAPKIRNTW